MAVTERVARGGVEPPTFRFSVGRSYQLSYLAVLRGRLYRIPHPVNVVRAVREPL